MFHSFIDKGTGPALLLLHPIGTGPELFDEIVARLSVHRRVLAPWLPGYGETPLVREDPSLAEATAKLAEDLAALGVDRCPALGMSGGGYRALALAIRHPALIESLYVLAGPARIDPEMASSLRASAAAARAGVDLGPALARGGLAPHYAESRPDSVARLEELVRAVSPESLAVDLETMAAAPSLLDGVAGLDVPITLRMGDADAMVPMERTREIVSVARRAALETVPCAAHVLLLEDREGTIASIVRWLEANDRRNL